MPLQKRFNSNWVSESSPPARHGSSFACMRSRDGSYSWRYAVSWLAVALPIALHVVFMADPSIPLFGLIKEYLSFVAVIKVVLTVTLIAVLASVFSTAVGYLRLLMRLRTTRIGGRLLGARWNDLGICAHWSPPTYRLDCTDRTAGLTQTR